MPLATVATGVGMQVVTHAASIWLGARRERAGRDAELIDLVRISVRDHFQQRKLVRQLEDLADQIAERLRPVYEHEFRDMAENERAAALLAVVDALQAVDLTDDTLFAVDVDACKLAQLVRQRVPVRRVGLAEPAEQLYDLVLGQSCMKLVQVIKQLPAFEPRALAELEQFGIDVRRYKPRTLVSVAYLSLQVSVDPSG
jgi:hypothetical protein